MANIGGVSDDGEDDIGLSSHSFGRIYPVGTHGKQGLSFGLRSGKDGELVAGVDQMGTHG